MPFQNTFALSCLLSPFMVGEGNADDSFPIFARNDVNAFYADYEVIAGHPECSQPDQLAIRTNIQADGLSYRIHDVQEGRFVDIGTDGAFDGGQCYRTVRRGTETVRYEAECGSEQTARSEPLADLGVQLGFTAEITSCFSPSGYKALEGTWSFVAKNAQNEVLSSGYVGRAANSEPNSRLDAETVAVQLRYVLFGTGYWDWQGLLRDVPEAAILEGATVIEAKFDCIPFHQEGYPASSLYIETDIGLLLTKQALQACTSRICHNRNLYRSTSTQARRCVVD